MFEHFTTREIFSYAIIGAVALISLQIGISHGRKLERREILTPYTESNTEALRQLTEQSCTISNCRILAYAFCGRCHHQPQ